MLATLLAVSLGVRAQTERNKLASELSRLNRELTESQTALQTCQEPLVKTNASEEDSGEVQGSMSPTGTIMGTITIATTAPTDNLIVCARDIYSQQEYCTDVITPAQTGNYEYALEIPTTTYTVFATNPPAETEFFYADVVGGIARQLTIVDGETQADINFTIE